MTLLSELIKSCFDNSANTYDSVAEVQIKSSKQLADLVKSNIDIENVNSILDIGCGTGNTSLEFLKKYPEAELCLCDISEKMLEIATRKVPKPIKTICCDAEFYDFDGYYDLIVSNFSLQWFENIFAFINRVKRYGKTFAFSTLLNGSFKRYKELFSIPPTFEYPEERDLLKFISRIKVHEVRSYSVEFENFFALARYFKKMGAYLKNSKEKNRDCLIFKENEPIFLDYEVFFGIV